MIAAFGQEFDTDAAPTWQFNVVIKQPSMPVDLSALASSLCLAAFTRVLLFSAICALETDPLRAGLGYSREAVLSPGEYLVCASDRATARQAVQTTLAIINDKS